MGNVSESFCETITEESYDQVCFVGRFRGFVLQQHHQDDDGVTLGRGGLPQGDCFHLF